jgi:hypothetical protein
MKMLRSSVHRLGLRILALAFGLSIFMHEALGIDISDFDTKVYKPDNIVGIGPQTGGGVETRISSYLQFAINLILYASGSAAVLFLILGGIRYITSIGDEEAMKKAKSLVTHAVIGLFAVILAYALVTNVISLIYRATT